MSRSILNAPVACFQVHPEVLKTYREKNLNFLMYTMEKFGQQTPVKVIERGGKLFVLDGVSLLKAATQLGLPSLIYEVVEVDDNKIIEYRMMSNQRTKRTFTELCHEVERVLNLIGSSQGKKRDLMGFEDFFEDNNYGEVGKDRYELAAALLGIDMKSSTLRKAMNVHWSEFKPEGKSESGIIELLDEGRISIDKAYKLVCDRDRKKNEKVNTERAKLFIAHSNLNGEDKPYKLYNKSSINMDEVPDNSIDLIIDSHPYWKLRGYRNQDELLHGQEPTREEYIVNFKKINEEKFRKLKLGGVLVTVIGETYQEGYQGVCSRAELSLDEIGFISIDVIPWIKSNQKRTPHPFRFPNTYERIIVAYKPGAEPYFNPVYMKGSVEDYIAKRTSSGGWYMASPDVCIPNVIVTPVFDPKILREIDPDFRHDAPCPPEIYEIFIEAYSKPGDTILDGFVGAGTAGVALKMGRKVIGYDVDPLSIEFSKKRFDRFLKQGQQENKKDDEDTLSVAA